MISLDILTPSINVRSVMVSLQLGIGGLDSQCLYNINVHLLIQANILMHDHRLSGNCPIHIS